MSCIDSVDKQYQEQAGRKYCTGTQCNVNIGGNPDVHALVYTSPDSRSMYDHIRWRRQIHEQSLLAVLRYREMFLGASTFVPEFLPGRPLGQRKAFL
jgi:hypothetical protein